MIAVPIGHPIAYPIGLRRACPNRPRIAHIESCHVSPLSIQDQSGIVTLRAGDWNWR